MRRGDVFRLRLRPGKGHEQQGAQYGVVVQADALLVLSTVLVAPTSRSARSATFRPQIEIGGTSTLVLVEQTGPVDRTRLGDFAGHVTAEEQWGIDRALTSVLDLT